MIRLTPLAALLVATPALAASPLEGNWTNPGGTVTVRIAPCGRELLCGRVVRASPSAIDKAAAAGTRLIGAELMSDLEPVAQGAWHGSFFVPDRNVRADGEVHLLSARTLEVEGCAMGGLLCKSQQWTRVSSPAPARKRRPAR
jgi:uncharacterized protein (DUF2147 family)